MMYLKLDAKLFVPGRTKIKKVFQISSFLNINFALTV